MKDIKDIEVTFTEVGTGERERAKEEKSITLTFTPMESWWMLWYITGLKEAGNDMPVSKVPSSNRKLINEIIDRIEKKVEIGLMPYKGK